MLKPVLVKLINEKLNLRQRYHFQFVTLDGF